MIKYLYSKGGIRIMTKKQEAYIFIFFQTALVILLESIKTYKLNIINTSISYSMFVILLLLFLSHYITKKYNIRYALLGVFISGLLTLLFMIIMSFALGKIFIINDYLGELFAYLICEMINVVFYSYILNNTKEHKVIILLNYIFSLLFFHMIYTLYYLNYIELNNFWYKYVITLGLQIILLIPLTIIDKKIKRSLLK